MTRCPRLLVVLLGSLFAAVGGAEASPRRILALQAFFAPAEDARLVALWQQALQHPDAECPAVVAPSGPPRGLGEHRTLPLAPTTVHYVVTRTGVRDNDR